MEEARGTSFEQESCRVDVDAPLCVQGAAFDGALMSMGLGTWKTIAPGVIAAGALARASLVYLGLLPVGAFVEEPLYTC